MNTKKLVCLLLVLALTLGAFPAALAAPGEAERVTVSFTSQAEGAFLHAPQLDVEVAAGLAEGYGYTDSVADGVSALDVLVRAHEVVFEGDFTAETKADYLMVSDSGSISKLFGIETGDCGFAVDHTQPHDDVFNEAYSAYGAYTVAQAAVKDGGLVEFFLYQTQYGMLDYYVWFAQEDRRVDTLSLTAGETVALDVEGYTMSWYGSSSQEVIDKNIANTRDYGYLEGGQAAWVDPETGALEPIPGALINEDSVLTLTAPEKPGTYYLTVSLVPEGSGYDPAISMPLVEVTVAPARSAGAPDRVADYLCVNSQYTNGSYGSDPESTLYGGMVSLGNFGGSITYYYEDGLRDDPAHLYGVDFYVNGNANAGSANAKTSFFEPGQVWVSEEGERWYALAGSAHYDDGVDWDYTVTYQKTPEGKTAWTDSLGNSADDARFSGPWPSQAAQETLTLSGVLLPAQDDQAVSAGVAADAYPTQWGYADCLPNGTENPYLDNSSFDLASSGFDLAWAVDTQGLPVDVSDKEFHYVKIQTASNLWHPAFGEKSPEIAGVVRADAQPQAVGKTALPQSVTVTDGDAVLTIPLQDDRQVYDLDVGEMKPLSLSVQGAAEGDNVYLNNRRLAPGQALEGLHLTAGTPRLVRLLVQTGDKEPIICILRLTGSTTDDPNKDPGDNTGDKDRPTRPTAKLSVWFSLLGDDRHGPLDSGETPHTLAGGSLTTWVESTRVQVSAPATVLDVVEAALADGHTFENAGGNYISAVDGLAELDNGPRSGWLYTLNGRHPDLGAADQAVKSGDKIVLHYTDDWSLEKDPLTPGRPSGGGSGSRPDKGTSQQTTQTTPGPEAVVFADMAGHWAQGAVDFVCARGLFRGTGANVFSPDMPMSRAMLVTVLYRLEDAAAVNSAPAFADVDADAWYADAVAWANSQGIVTGTGEGFAPARDITRQELALMLHRYAKSAGMDLTKAAKLDGYADAGHVAPWAKEAMAWAVETGLIQGRSGSSLAPDGTATRAEVATVLQRLVERMVK